MQPASRIFVAGARGLAGRALVAALRAEGFERLLTPTHAELDLEDAQATRRFFHAERPEYVVVAAAKVGGIMANQTYPVDFLCRNLSIASNVISEARAGGVRRLIFLGSSCIYPRDCPQPIREEALLSGPLEASNRPYAIAKIAGIELCWAFNRQHGTRFLSAMPTNLYGPGDNYDLNTSHVLPALIRKMHEAKAAGQAFATVWGSGTPRREFLHSHDLARALVFLLRLEEPAWAALADPARAPLVNIGCGEDLPIAELARLVADTVGFAGTLEFDRSKPDGTPRKVLDVRVLRQLGWAPAVSLREGLRQTYADFLAERRAEPAAA